METRNRSISLVCLLLSVAFIGLRTPPLSAVKERPPGHPFPDAVSYSPLVEEIINRFDEARYEKSLKEISGFQQAFVGDREITVATRYSLPMFRHRPHANAAGFIVQELEQAGLSPEIDAYAGLEEGDVYFNIVAEIPGESNPTTVYVLCAHFDSRSMQPMLLAPGADDNGTGVALLLEAARVLALYRFENTIRIIFFSGEENGRLGSRHYTGQLAQAGEAVAGAMNFDMFGWDSDNDLLMNLHVGPDAQSQSLGQVFSDVNSLYALGLTVELYDVERMSGYSDHMSFWDHGWPAFLAVENFLSADETEWDKNPFYHSIGDVFTEINLPYAIAISRCGLGTAADLAIPVRACAPAAPSGLAGDASDSNLVRLQWDPVPGAAAYDVFRNTSGCDKGLVLIGRSGTAALEDWDVQGGLTYTYRVRAIAECPSELSECLNVVASGPCGLTPDFAGVARVENEGSSPCSLRLEWEPGQERCPVGGSVSYNVYRSRNPSFAPSPSTLVASGLSGLSWVDSGNLMPMQSYYYVVRAEDGTTQGGGPANNGNEDGNVHRVNGLSTGAVSEIFFDDMENGSTGWLHGTTAEYELWELGSPSGVGRNDPDRAYSGTSVWATDLGNYYSDGDYEADSFSYLESPAIDCSGLSTVRLSFRRWLSVQDRRFDSARCLIMDSGQELFGNGFSPSPSDFLDTSWFLVDRDISRYAAGKTIYLRYDLFANREGQLGGWNLDDVRIYSAEACQPDAACAAPPPDVGNTLFMSKEAGQTLVLWTDPADSTAFRVYRAELKSLADLAPISPVGYDRVGFYDPLLLDGSYYYKVQALNSCGEGPF